MARKVRVFVKDTPQHILIESLPDIKLFLEESDYSFFYEKLCQLSLKYQLDIHAYTLEKKFFQYIATPSTEESISKFMQSLGKSYVTYYNKKYNRTGTLWNGRYKSSLVEQKLFLFDIMHYIESFPSSYSSQKSNQKLKKDPLIVLHPIYKNLAFTDESRVKLYNKHQISQEHLEFIKESLQKQTITGTKYFIKELEQKLGESLSPKKRGRPQSQSKNIKRKNMYKNLVLLDKNNHKDLKINPLQNLNFAKGMKFIPTLVQEVKTISNSFPVVFTSDENTSLVTIVSLGADNLALTSDGKWQATYIPAVLRKYPFQLASTKENTDTKVILIDEDAELFSTSNGEPLFTKDETPSAVLENAKNFLLSFDSQAAITNNIIKLIKEADILEDREIAVGQGEDKKVLVNGFKVVSKEKLYDLSDDILADWARKGILSFIDSHLESLSHIQNLFTLASSRQ